MEQRLILHLDMDYFYAQIEERDNPKIKGKPVIVCMVSAREGSMGAIATCNYQARALGMHAGMPCVFAKKKAPEGAFIPARRDYYSTVSDSIMEELRNRCDTLEQVSIDEAYMDVTSRADYDSAAELITAIKGAVYEKERLTCSIGAGPNKLIAKMASSAKKPDGTTIIRPSEAETFLDSMPAAKLHGIGEKTADKLAQKGVNTIHDLKGLTMDELSAEFGQSRGLLLYNHSRGIDDTPVMEREKEQCGRLASLKADTRDLPQLDGLLDSLAGDVVSRLQSKGVDFRTVSATFVLENMDMRTKSRSLPAQTQSLEALKDTAKSLLREFMSENDSKIRRIGVTASGLRPKSGQKTLGEY